MADYSRDNYSNILYTIVDHKLTLFVDSSSASLQTKAQFSPSHRPIWESEKSFGEVTEVEVRSSLTFIPEYTFYNCSNIKTIKISTNIPIRKYAFSGMENLKEIYIGTEYLYQNPNASYLPFNPATQTEGLFQNTGIENLSIGSGYKSLGNYAFDGCKKLRYIELPETIDTLYYSVFRGCHLLNSINLFTSKVENNTTTYTDIAYYTNGGKNAPFQDCINLRELVIPSLKNNIGDGEDITLSSLFGNVTSLDEANMNLIYDVGEYKIPKSLSKIRVLKSNTRQETTQEGDELTITYIPQNSFMGMSFISSVTLPDSCVEIGKSAFEECINLSNCTIAQVSIIRERAFYHCKKYTPNKIQGDIRIYDKAFKYCSGIKTLSLNYSSSQTIIYGSPFAGCNNLKSLSIGDTWICPILNRDENGNPNYDNNPIYMVTFAHLRDLFEGILPNSLETVNLRAIMRSTGASNLVFNEDFFENDNVVKNPSQIKTLNIEVYTQSSDNKISIYHTFSNLVSLRNFSFIVRGCELNDGRIILNDDNQGYIVGYGNDTMNSELWRVFYHSRLWARYIEKIKVESRNLTTRSNGVYNKVGNYAGRILEYYPRGAKTLTLADDIFDVDAGGLVTGDSGKWSSSSYGPLQRCLFSDVDISNTPIVSSYLMFKDCPNIIKMKINHKLLSQFKFYQLFSSQEGQDCIPKSVSIVIVTASDSTSIEKYLFEYAHLDYLILPYNIKRIEDYAFWNAKIRVLGIPSSLEELSDNALVTYETSWGNLHTIVFPLVYYYGTKFEFENNLKKLKYIKLICFGEDRLSNDAYTIGININVNNSVETIHTSQSALDSTNVDYYKYMNLEFDVYDNI